MGAQATAASAPRGVTAIRFLILVLMAVYIVPLFVPPPATPPAPLAFDATILERLFPGVPGWWVVTRLLCLFSAAGLTLLAQPRSVLGATPRRATELPALATHDRRLHLALGLAGLQAIAGLWAAHFDRLTQLLYVACFAVPPLLLLTGCRQVHRRRNLWPLLAVGALVVVWLGLRVPLAWSSPRAADLPDMWVGLRDLVRASDPDFNLLTGRFHGSGGSLHLIFQGAALAAYTGIPPSFALAQGVQFAWYTVAAIGLGLLANRLFGLAGATVATAAFLCSPFVLMTLLTPIVFGFAQTLAVAMLWLLVKVRDDRSLAALAALGAVAGISTTFPAAAAMASIVFATAVWSAWRGVPRLPKRSLAVAIFLYMAAVFTAIPDVRSTGGQTQAYTAGREEWVIHEMAGFGQISGAASEFALDTAIRRPFDTPLSAMLAPFALPRIALRVLADVLFDPAGAALAAIGVVICIKATIASWFARLLLCLFVVVFLPAIASSQDRLSVVRLVMAPVPMALMTAAGWDVLRRWCEPRGAPAMATAVATVAIAAGGMVLFDRVHPRLLVRSSTGIVLSALESRPENLAAIILDHPKPVSFPYWYLDEFAAGLTRAPFLVRVYQPLDDSWLYVADGKPADVYFWNPTLEQEHQVSRAICRRWPAALIYVLTDQTSYARAFASWPQDKGWTPALPREQWEVLDCHAQLATESTWAAGVLREAERLQAQGERAAAVRTLQVAARRSFGASDVFEATARALLDAGATPAALREALHWAQRACLSSRKQDAQAYTTLAAVHAARGETREAIAAARQAHELARASGNSELSARIERDLREYTGTHFED